MPFTFNATSLNITDYGVIALAAAEARKLKYLSLRVIGDVPAVSVSCRFHLCSDGSTEIKTLVPVVCRENPCATRNGEGLLQGVSETGNSGSDRRGEDGRRGASSRHSELRWENISRTQSSCSAFKSNLSGEGACDRLAAMGQLSRHSPSQDFVTDTIRAARRASLGGGLTQQPVLPTKDKSHATGSSAWPSVLTSTPSEQLVPSMRVTVHTDGNRGRSFLAPQRDPVRRVVSNTYVALPRPRALRSSAEVLR